MVTVIFRIIPYFGGPAPELVSNICSPSMFLDRLVAEVLLHGVILALHVYRERNLPFFVALFHPPVKIALLGLGRVEVPPACVDTLRPLLS